MTDLFNNYGVQLSHLLSKQGGLEACFGGVCFCLADFQI